MSTHWMRTSLTAIAAAALLTACGGGGGGGGGDDDGGELPPSTGEGSFAGRVVDSQGTAVPNEFFNIVVLSNGSYYGVLSSTTNAGVRGLLQGSGSFSNPVFTSSSGQAFSFGNSAAPVNATVNYAVAQATIVGSSTISNASNTLVRFRADFEPDYNQPASFATLAGSYSGQVLRGAGPAPWTLTVNSSGVFAATTGSCQINGAFVVRPGGKAIFDFSATYDQASCGSSATFTGIGYNSGANDVVLTAVRADRGDALFGVLGR